MVNKFLVKYNKYEFLRKRNLKKDISVSQLILFSDKRELFVHTYFQKGRNFIVNEVNMCTLMFHVRLVPSGISAVLSFTLF